MAPDDHGDIWSLCETPSTHLLIGYAGGVTISPETPKVGSDIHVQVKGNLCMYNMCAMILEIYTICSERCGRRKGGY